MLRYSGGLIIGSVLGLCNTTFHESSQRMNIIRYCLLSLIAPMLVLVSLASSALAFTTIQTTQDTFQGRSYLYVEAEDFASRGVGVGSNGWTVVDKNTPLISAQGLDILPANSNVSGEALFDDLDGSFHTDTAVYQVQFMTPGIYQFYTRHSLYDWNGNGNYGNEDSLFVSPAFNLNSESDWIGFQGLEFDEQDVNVDIPNPGFALDPDGFKPATANSSNDGWLATRDWGVKSAGVVTFPNNTAGPEWNGNFNWYHRPAFVSTNAAGGFDSDFGFKTEYTVTPAQVGQTLTFEIGSREPYAVLDGFLFIQDDDVDLLDTYTQSQLDAVLPIVPNADFDNSGIVDGTDLLRWTSGYGTATGALQANGDADFDGDIDGVDFLIWQRQAGSTAASLQTIPEPSSCVLLIGWLCVVLPAMRRCPKHFS